MAWNTDRRRLVVVSVGLALVGLAVLAAWQLKRTLAPRPVQAWVAIEVADSGVAEVGRVEVTAGTACTLHAVLEARKPGGGTVYYTEAPGLVMDGQRVAADALRRWKGGTSIQVLWFTVEGLKPYVEADASFRLDVPGFRSSFRADWPRTWAVPAVLESSSSSFAQGRELLHGGDFGTQRYHVRLEFYPAADAIMPAQRFSSWTEESLPAEAARFATLVARLPEPLEPLSRLFGLTQVEPTPTSPAGLEAVLTRWQRQDLAFSRIGAIHALIGEREVAAGELEWSEVDLSGGPVWGAAGFSAGDLARVGDRVVVIAADRGQKDRLDRDDLCIDFARGIAVRPLGEVFSGEDGLIEWAQLDATAAGDSE